MIQLRILGLICAFFGGVLLQSAASAQDIPDDMLVVDYAKCMQNCLDSQDKMTCEVLCGCTMSRFREELSLDQYSKLLDEMNRDEVSDEHRAFLDETAQQCVGELDKLLEQATAPEKGTALPPPDMTDDSDDGGGN